MTIIRLMALYFACRQWLVELARRLNTRLDADSDRPISRMLVLLNLLAFYRGNIR